MVSPACAAEAFLYFLEMLDFLWKIVNDEPLSCNCSCANGTLYPSSELVLGARLLHLSSGMIIWIFSLQAGIFTSPGNATYRIKTDSVQFGCTWMNILYHAFNEAGDPQCHAELTRMFRGHVPFEKKWLLPL